MNQHASAGGLVGIVVAFAAVCGRVSAQCDLNETHKLVATDGEAFDFLGVSVAFGNDRIILGAHGDDSAAGSAYFFNATTGQELFKRSASDATQNASFGWSAAVDGNLAIIGAPLQDNSGAAYIFDLTTGKELLKLTASDPEATPSSVGRSVAIDGDRAVVGSVLFDDKGDAIEAAFVFDVTTGLQLVKLVYSDPASVNSTFLSVGISGERAIMGAHLDDENGSGAGAAYLFDVSTGQQVAKLLASDGAPGDRFGVSVAIEGNVAVVGADLDDDLGEDSGAVYVFNVTTGAQLAKLLPTDSQAALFGHHVAIDGPRALVGSSNYDEPVNAGVAYAFDLTTFQQEFKLTASDRAFDDVFGFGVALDGDRAVVGALQDSNENGQFAGSAYLFDLTCAVPCTAEITSAEVTYGQNEGPQDPAKLGADDDDRVLTISRTFLSAQEPNLGRLRIDADASACIGPSPSISLTIQDHASQPGVTNRVLLKKTTGGSDQVGQYALSFNVDQNHAIEIADGTPYVEADGTIVAVLRYSTLALLSPLGMEARTDVVTITVE